MRTSRLMLSACFFVLTSSIPLLNSPSAQAQAKVPKGDVYLGFSRTGNDTFYPNAGGLNGWEGAMHVKLRRPFLGVEGDLSHYGIGANSSVPRTTIFMVGPRLTVGALGPMVYAHALVGGEHSANSSGSASISGGAMAWALGGGLNVPIAPFFAWRVAGDYLRAPTQAPDGSTPARFSTGLVFRF